MGCGDEGGGRAGGVGLGVWGGVGVWGVSALK